MYLRIYRDVTGPHNFWCEWAVTRHAPKSQPNGYPVLWYPLFEGEGFVNTLNGIELDGFDLVKSPHYDPARCGVFADWLQDNAERLTAHFSEEDRPLALERLQNLCDWLRRGLQVEA